MILIKQPFYIFGFHLSCMASGCFYIYKLYSHNDIIKHIQRNHGKDFITVVKSFENLKTEYEKVLNLY